MEGGILDEVYGIMEGNYGKLGLDRCEHGLSNRKGMEPRQKGFKMGEVWGNGRINNGLSNIGKNKGYIKNKSYVVFFKEIP